MSKRNYGSLLGVTLICIYLFFANNIILKIFNKAEDVQVVAGDELKNTRNVFNDFDKMYSLDNFTHDYYIQGWAFVPCESMGEYDSMHVSYENVDKYIDLYLKSEKNAYLIKTNPVSRLDLCTVFKDSVAIHGMYHGFTTIFSTINIKDGVYELIIDTHENETDFGLEGSAVRYVKGGTEFFRYEDTPIGLQGTFETLSDIQFHLDGIYINNNRLCYEGWGVSNSLDIESVTPYLEITSANGETMFFPVSVQYREDIATGLGNENFLNSGIKGYINTSNLEPGDYVIHLLYKDHGMIYRSKQSLDINYQKDSVKLISK